MPRRRVRHYTGVRRHSPATLPARFTIPALAFILSLLTWLPAAAAQGQIIDRVVAVVAGDPITLSDVAAASRLGIVTPANGGDQSQVLELLIERRLQLIEVNRYLPPEPSAADIDKGVAAIRARFASDDEYATALREVGVSPEQLRTTVRDSLRIASYLQQRFGANYQPTDDDIARYYKANAAEFARNGVTPPLAEARDAVRARILDQRMAALVRDWIDGLRRRGEVTILPR